MSCSVNWTRYHSCQQFIERATICLTLAECAAYFYIAQFRAFLVTIKLLWSFLEARTLLLETKLSCTLNVSLAYM